MSSSAAFIPTSPQAQWWFWSPFQSRTYDMRRSITFSAQKGSSRTSLIAMKT